VRSAAWHDNVIACPVLRRACSPSACAAKLYRRCTTRRASPFTGAADPGSSPHAGPSLRGSRVRLPPARARTAVGPLCCASPLCCAAEPSRPRSTLLSVFAWASCPGAKKATPVVWCPPLGSTEAGTCPSPPPPQCSTLAHQAGQRLHPGPAPGPRNAGGRRQGVPGPFSRLAAVAPLSMLFTDRSPPHLHLVFAEPSAHASAVPPPLPWLPFPPCNLPHAAHPSNSPLPRCTQAALARDAVDNLERLGPTFVKLGQIMSIRPDVLPPAVMGELAKLQVSAWVGARWGCVGQSRLVAGGGWPEQPRRGGGRLVAHRVPASIAALVPPFTLDLCSPPPLLPPLHFPACRTRLSPSRP
jgi:hypothetical protein